MLFGKCSAPRVMGNRAAIVTVTLLSVACAKPPASYRPPTPLGLDEYYFVPDSNPLTRETVALGERLFFDTVLSADSSTACASCHQPSRAFSDSVPLSRGAHGRRTQRNTPSIINRAYGRMFFWNGRTIGLEETVVQPIQNPVEMDLTLDELVRRLGADARYTSAFANAFPEGVTEQTIARALASYVRTLRFGNAPVDRYFTSDRDALSADAKAGLRLFSGRANCVSCHVGPNLTDEKLHNTGVSWGSGDLGHFEVSGDSADRGTFKTPTLRNVPLTAPYMHDGSLMTLQDVIEHYVRGGTQNPNLDREIRPLALNDQDKRNIVAFLRSLTGEIGSR